MADFGGLKAIQTVAGNPHVFGQDAARSAQALLDIWNGPADTDRVLRIMETGQVRAPDGTVALPAYAFESDIDTGIIRKAENQLQFVVGGVGSLFVTTGTVTSQQPVRGIDGTLGAPSYSFTSDVDTGLRLSAPGDLRIVVAGVDIARIVAGALRGLGQVLSDRHDNSNSGAVDWNDGNNQKIDLDANKTITLANPVAGAFYTLELVQDVTGSRTVTWPAAVKGEDGGAAPQPDGTASRTTLIGLYFNGTSYAAKDGGSWDL